MASAYNLIERTVERELVPMAKALNLGVLAWSPLAGGTLSGKYHGDGKADGGRMTNEGMKEFLPGEQRAAPIISAVKSVSEQTGRSMAQVALAWLRHQTVPVIPIIEFPSAFGTYHGLGNTVVSGWAKCWNHPSVPCRMLDKTS